MQHIEPILLIKYTLCNIGVPQGSVLSLVLFLLFISDLPTATEHRFINLFADDTSMCGGEREFGNLEVLIQQDI